MKYDIIVIGSGPGGYVAAIRAAQLGKKVAIVERDELGGVCLNWGCIPTKALLKCAHVYSDAAKAADFGVEIEGGVRADMAKMHQRSRNVSDTMNKGVSYLLNKNKVDVVKGTAKLTGSGTVVVTVDSEGSSQAVTLQADHIILSTGARPRELPSLPIDGRYVLSSKHALMLKRLPQSMIVVGSGAIGSEFACLFATLGVKVTIVEYFPQIIPFEDEEVSKYMDRSFRKMRVGVLTGTEVKSVRVENEKCYAEVVSDKGSQTLESDMILAAVGIKSNIENIGLEELGVAVERDKIVVDEFYRTSVGGVYAIGDIVPGAALAHVASAAAICCVEKICGLDPKPVDYSTIPMCIYTVPEVASVGITEQQARSEGRAVRIGKFPLSASGRATTAGDRDGFIKLIFDEASDELIGAHLVGLNVTEIISELTLAKKLKATAHQIGRTIHPHPSISESVMEAAEASLGISIHI